MADIVLKGLDELLHGLEERVRYDLLKEAVKVNGAELTKSMKDEAVFTHGYSHGDTRRSIELSITDGGLTATVKPTTAYSPYLEYGTRFMEAQPFVRPSYEKQKVKFLEDTKRLMR